MSSPTPMTDFAENEDSGDISPMDFPRSPSVDSVASVASSVDDLQIEVKSQHKKKIIFTSVLVIISLIVAAVLVFGVREATDGFKVGNNEDKVTASMVLPNTTLEISVISDSKTKGNIYYYSSEYKPNELGFSFYSFFNSTHDIVSFKADADDIGQLDDNYLDILNNFCGFEIDLIDGNKESPHNSSAYDADHKSQLMFNIYRCDSSIINVVWNHFSGNTSGDNEPVSENSELLSDMAQSKLGQYFVELSIKLGSNEYMGYDMRSVSFIGNYARYLWQLCDEDEENCNWDKDILREAVSLTNQIISGNKTNSDGTSSTETTIGTSDDYGHGVKKNSTDTLESSRRLLNGCSPYESIADGYCDSSLNTAACDWDGGDCCSHTCNNAIDWEDENGVDYDGYNCGSNGYNCVPGCNVANPSWLGDGYCDKTGGYNTVECNYDLGDCCEETCKSGAYSCGSNGYSCSNPKPSWCPRDRCGNECFGMCGAGCDCWEWTCGDCHCHGECSEHDGYCSCDGMFAFWCVNVFWVNCDDGSIAVF